MSNHFDVGEFHRKFELPHVNPEVMCGNKVPHLVSHDVALFRAAFMAEELVEFQQAVLRDDLAGAADALVDLAYVVLGTAHLMHLPWQELWDAVHAANMKKERGPTDKRGHALDVRKPPSWEPPDVEAVLRAAGWEG